MAVIVLPGGGQINLPVPRPQGAGTLGQIGGQSDALALLLRQLEQDESREFQREQFEFQKQIQQEQLGIRKQEAEQDDRDAAFGLVQDIVGKRNTKISRKIREAKDNVVQDQAIEPYADSYGKVMSHFAAIRPRLGAGAAPEGLEGTITRGFLGKVQRTFEEEMSKGKFNGMGAATAMRDVLEGLVATGNEGVITLTAPALAKLQREHTEDIVGSASDLAFGTRGLSARMESLTAEATRELQPYFTALDDQAENLSLKMNEVALDPSLRTRQDYFRVLRDKLNTAARDFKPVSIQDFRGQQKGEVVNDPDRPGQMVQGRPSTETTSAVPGQRRAASLFADIEDEPTDVISITRREVEETGPTFRAVTETGPDDPFGLQEVLGHIGGGIVDPLRIMGLGLKEFGRSTFRGLPLSGPMSLEEARSQAMKDKLLGLSDEEIERKFKANMGLGPGPRSNFLPAPTAEEMERHRQSIAERIRTNQEGVEGRQPRNLTAPQPLMGPPAPSSPVSIEDLIIRQSDPLFGILPDPGPPTPEELLRILEGR